MQDEAARALIWIHGSIGCLPAAASRDYSLYGELHDEKAE
jgi:hypothetical protein